MTDLERIANLNKAFLGFFFFRPFDDPICTHLLIASGSEIHSAYLPTSQVDIRATALPWGQVFFYHGNNRWQVWGVTNAKDNTRTVTWTYLDTPNQTNGHYK